MSLALHISSRANSRIAAHVPFLATALLVAPLGFGHCLAFLRSLIQEAVSTA
jgi:hypothetical protein